MLGSERDRDPPAASPSAGSAGLHIDYPVSLDEARRYRRLEAKGRPNRKTRARHRMEEAFARDVFGRLGPDAAVVDVPCGNGRFFACFRTARRLTMIDQAPSMVRAARELTGAPANTRILAADIFALPLPTASADLCFCMRLFHHMPTDAMRVAALGELARVSRHLVAVSFYNRRCLRHLRRRLLGRRIRGAYTDFPSMVAFARRAGLAPITRVPAINVVEQQCLVLFRKV